MNFFNNSDKINKIALILCLDSNNARAKYEYECLLNIYHWRSTNHILKNCDILIYIEKSSNIKTATLHTIKKYENIKIKYYEFNTKYKCLNTLYCQYLFEINEIQYDYGIYIDLDLYLINQIPLQYLFQDKTVFYTYTINNKFEKDSFGYRLLNCSKLNILPFNTFFIINKRQNNIFSKLYKCMYSKEYNNFFNRYLLYDNDTFYYEEGVYDYAYYTNIINTNNSLFITENELNILNLSYNKFVTPINILSYIFIHKHITSYFDYINLLKSSQIQ